MTSAAKTKKDPTTQGLDESKQSPCQVVESMKISEALTRSLPILAKGKRVKLECLAKNIECRKLIVFLAVVVVCLICLTPEGSTNITNHIPAYFVILDILVCLVNLQML
jgi:hypothetical protein